jgi:DNA mismatch repair protein MutS
MHTDISTKLSPMMAQWHSCKAKAPDALLLFRLGDFYEAFYEDAKVLSKELDIVLTRRQEIPMAGIPAHASDTYFDRLISRGFRVAIAEQMEDPKQVKGLVKRDIVRILTPGTVTQSSLLVDKAYNFLGCIVQVGETFALSIIDVTTADFKALEFESTRDLIDALHRLRPKELLISTKWQAKQGALLEELASTLKILITAREEWHFDPVHTSNLLMRHLGVLTLDGFGLKAKVAAITASGAILHYMHEELHLPIDHIKSIASEQNSGYLQIDRTTQKHLELFSLSEQQGRQLALIDILDETKTPMGGRLLKTWLARPLLDLDAIHQRQEGIGQLLSHEECARKIRAYLAQIHDLQRLLMRVQMRSAGPRDLIALKVSLRQIEPIKKELSALKSPLCSELFDVADLVDLLERALIEPPPPTSSDTPLFKEGFHAELDALTQLKTQSATWVTDYQNRLREEVQIKTLKVGYTGAFGYYIEVGKGRALPAFFERKQTLVNAERFTTRELKDFEYKILHCEEQIKALQQELFVRLRDQITSRATQIHCIAGSIAHLDALSSLAHVAHRRGFTRPLVDHSGLLHIEGGRHPVIEVAIGKEAYIPSDLILDTENERLHIITGPNMAGKSTFIRQAALIAILAQMGSYVPAVKAHVGLIDKIFTRIGASDDLSRGQSTFMVEMTETASILNNATAKSLVILDEIGRGTSTYDGISIAWAVAEYLLTQVGKQAKVLFATHYCELISLEKQIPGAVNYHVAVHESDKGIVFLRRIVRGGTDKSYGIHVAKLAGIPLTVIRRAEELLKTFEKKERAPKPPQEQMQLPLFAHPTVESRVLSELKTLDPLNMTPLQALELLMRWKTENY